VPTATAAAAIDLGPGQNAGTEKPDAEGSEGQQQSTQTQNAAEGTKDSGWGDVSNPNNTTSGTTCTIIDGGKLWTGIQEFFHRNDKEDIKKEKRDKALKKYIDFEAADAWLEDNEGYRQASILQLLSDAPNNILLSRFFQWIYSAAKFLSVVLLSVTVGGGGASQINDKHVIIAMIVVAGFVMLLRSFKVVAMWGSFLRIRNKDFRPFKALWVSVRHAFALLCAIRPASVWAEMKDRAQSIKESFERRYKDGRGFCRAVQLAVAWYCYEIQTRCLQCISYFSPSRCSACSACSNCCSSATNCCSDFRSLANWPGCCTGTGSDDSSSVTEISDGQDSEGSSPCPQCPHCSQGPKCSNCSQCLLALQSPLDWARRSITSGYLTFISGCSSIPACPACRPCVSCAADEPDSPWRQTSAP